MAGPKSEVADSNPILTVTEPAFQINAIVSGLKSKSERVDSELGKYLLSASARYCKYCREVMILVRSRPDLRSLSNPP